MLMIMNHTVKDILKRSQEVNAQRKGRFTLWVTGSVVLEFKAAIGDISASKVIEQFMIKVIEEAKGGE